MNNSKKTYTGYLFLINTAHLALCMGVYLLRKFNLLDSTMAKGSIFIAAILTWFFFSAVTSLGMNLNRRIRGFVFNLLAVIPITLLTGICAALSYFTDNASLSWIKFFFIGSAVNFWFRPFSILSYFGETLWENVYIIYALIIVMLIFVSFLGSSFGISVGSRKHRVKRKKKSNRRQVQKRIESEISPFEPEEKEMGMQSSSSVPEEDTASGEEQATDAENAAVDTENAAVDTENAAVETENAAVDAKEAEPQRYEEEASKEILFDDIVPNTMEIPSEEDKPSSSDSGNEEPASAEETEPFFQDDEYVSLIVDPEIAPPEETLPPVPSHNTEILLVSENDMEDDLMHKEGSRKKYRIQVSSEENGDISRFIEIASREDKGDKEKGND